MNDTRALLNRIAHFRKRLEEMPRLIPAPLEAIEVEAEPEPEVADVGSRSQAILEYSLRQLDGAKETTTLALTERTRGLLADAHGLVTRLKAMADDTLLAGPPSREGISSVADPLVVHFRETSALTEAVVRYATTFPDSAGEQMRLCEGLEAMIDAARRRYDLLAGAMERKRIEVLRVDGLCRFLVALTQGDGPLDPSPLIELADALLAEERGRPLRLVHAGPDERQAYLGGPSFPAPTRFVAAHALNCGSIAARVARHDGDWRSHDRELVLAALIHDVGMLGVSPECLGRIEAIDQCLMEGHGRAGADWIVKRLPSLSWAAEVAATHHERANGSGYPHRLINDQMSSLTRLVAAIDVYAAMCCPRPHRAPHDPRAAMTDVLLMAERGMLDRHACEKLLCLGLYPAGTVVELGDGSTAVVLAPCDRSAKLHSPKPTVAVLADPIGKAFPNPRFLDLAEGNAGNVIRALGPLDRWQRIGRSYPEWA